VEETFAKMGLNENPSPHEGEGWVRGNNNFFKILFSKLLE
jgi:hypothetical protein